MSAISNPSPNLQSSDLQSLIDAYDEVTETEARLNTPYAILHNDSALDTYCSIISWFDLCTLLNESTYDMFGRIARETIDRHPDSTENKSYTLQAYAKEITDISSGYESLTVNQAIGVGEFLWDLWHDNEDSGVHDATGAFRNVEQDIIKKLVLADKARVDRDLGEMHWEGYYDRLASIAGLTGEEQVWLKYLMKEDKNNG
jgi:hypothetical protein